MAEKLLEIKGVGIRTVSGFLAEVGDISPSTIRKELQKLAGLALVENSSGKHKETTISRPVIWTATESSRNFTTRA